MPRYSIKYSVKHGGELAARQSSEVFLIEAGDVASFYWCKISGAYVHLSLVVTHLAGDGKKRQMSLGFYPKDGAMMASLLKAQDGEIWLPDPLYNKGKPVPVLHYSKRTHIKYSITAEIARRLNDILYSDKCAYTLEKNRLTCKIPQMYNMLSFVGKEPELNCISWLTTVFPSLEHDMYGDNVLHRLMKPVASVTSKVIRRI